MCREKPPLCRGGGVTQSQQRGERGAENFSAKQKAARRRLDEAFAPCYNRNQKDGCRWHGGFPEKDLLEKNRSCLMGGYFFSTRLRVPKIIVAINVSRA